MISRSSPNSARSCRQAPHGVAGGSTPLATTIRTRLRFPAATAAPTAGLHFTPELLSQLDVERVTLHVGLDTFRPVNDLVPGNATADRPLEFDLVPAWGADLARVIGCVEADLDPALDRFTAPYHAVKVTGALFHTQGGLDIDAQCRVLDDQGQPLPSLLAAGGAARGVSGDAVWGYMSGNGLLSALGGGWTAAGTAAEMLQT